MLANAARAAECASKLSWLVGRARHDENTRAIECASEAFEHALGMAKLDLVALADQAVPKLPPPITAAKPSSNPAALRILKALPT